jgi:anti-anti-sigma factor
MTEVTFVDSSALRELLRAARDFRVAGRPFVLAGVQPTVARLLELTQTTDAFAHTATVEQALARASTVDGDPR